MADYNAGTVHKNPTLDGYGNCTVERQGNNVHVYGSASMHKGSGYGRMYGYHYACEIRWNNNVVHWFYIKNNNTGYKNQDKTWTASYDITLNNYTSAGTVSIVYVCCGTGDGTYGHNCDVGYEYVTVYSASVGNAYTASSIWLNPNDYTKIGRVGSSSWSVHYSYNSGSNSNCPISLAIHDYGATSWGVRWEPVLRKVTGSSDGVWDSVTLSSAQGFANGSRYRITLVSNGR